MARLLLLGAGVVAVGIAAAWVFQEPLGVAAKSLAKSAARRSSVIGDFLQALREDLDDIGAELAAEQAEKTDSTAAAT